MGVLWGVLAVLAALVFLVTAFDVLRRRLSFGLTAAWLLLVLILPFIGSILYWILRTPPAGEIPAGATSPRS
jgi:Phospholipase_D-nuclease N-terminal